MALTVWENVTVTGQYAGLVASSWKGQTYIRSAPAKVNNNSPKQQKHKLLYKFVYTYFTPIYSIWIKDRYTQSKMTPMNYFIKSQTSNYWKSSLRSKWEQIEFPYGTLNAQVDASILRNYEKTGFELTNWKMKGTELNKVTQVLIYCNDENSGLWNAQIYNIDNLPNFFPMPILNEGKVQRMWIVCGNNTQGGIVSKH